MPRSLGAPTDRCAQAVSAQLGCLAQLATELEELRLGCPSLTEVACTEDVVHLGFVNLDKGEICGSGRAWGA